MEFKLEPRHTARIGGIAQCILAAANCGTGCIVSEQPCQCLPVAAGLFLNLSTKRLKPRVDQSHPRVRACSLAVFNSPSLKVHYPQKETQPPRYPEDALGS